MEIVLLCSILILVPLSYILDLHFETRTMGLEGWKHWRKIRPWMIWESYILVVGMVMIIPVIVALLIYGMIKGYVKLLDWVFDL